MDMGSVSKIMFHHLPAYAISFIIVIIYPFLDNIWQNLRNSYLIKLSTMKNSALRCVGWPPPIVTLSPFFLVLRTHGLVDDGLMRIALALGVIKLLALGSMLLGTVPTMCRRAVALRRTLKPALVGVEALSLITCKALV